MKAVTWHGKRDVRVDTVPDPKIEEPTDAIIEVTSTNICGSDLHLYEMLGAFMNPGDILGHEPMGIVREVGSEVDQPRRRRPGGDPVPNLLRQLLYVRSAALHAVRDDAGPRPGHGCRTVRLLRALRRRCPAARRSCCAYRKPSSPTSRSPTGRRTRGSSTSPTCCRRHGRRSPTPTFPTGGSVTVLGLGPIGDMAARIAAHLGYEVIAVDRVPERLARAEARGHANHRSQRSTTTISATSSAT